MTLIKDRAAKIRKMIDEYNSLIDDLPEDVEKPQKLDRTKGVDLCKAEEVDFWELDLKFRTREEWSVKADVRRAINAMYHNRRALEEIFILGSEAERYYNWLASRLNSCERLLSVLDVNSAIGNEILHVGLKAANAMEQLKDLGGVDLGDAEKFKSVREKLDGKVILTNLF